MGEMMKTVEPFNSALETGLRSLTILEAAYPASYDLQRLVELDYLVVHSADIGGPASLHAPLPMRGGELLVRRELVESGLLLMISRGLLVRVVTSTGISYQAGEAAAPYLASLTASYTQELKLRARWLVDNSKNLTLEGIREIIRNNFSKWSSEFEPIKKEARR